jgi:hypothetical protein
MKMKNIDRWILLLLAVLLTACSKDSESPQDKQPATINVYVYAPEKPIITRGDIGEVDPIDNTVNESKISKLQIWVFEHNTENLVAYYSPESVDNLNNGTGETYQLSASDAFALANPKPKVDVYVAVNETSAGLTLGNMTTRAALEAAMIGTDYFGLTTLTGQVPDNGFPMSGVLHGASVTGSAPVFQIPTITLTRAVSKIRFIFSRETGVKEIKINSIKLNGGMIPAQEYLFLESDETTTPPTTFKYHVGSNYVTDAKDFLGGAHLTEIPENDDPLAYSYQEGQDAQVYEALINNGLNNEEGGISKPLLKQVGPFYLRESDQKLAGTISYQIEKEKNGTGIVWDVEKTAIFEMADAGDFSRNHTWIVYAYYSVSGLVAVTVVLKDWNDNPASSHEVYNW